MTNPADLEWSHASFENVKWGVVNGVWYDLTEPAEPGEERIAIHLGASGVFMVDYDREVSGAGYTCGGPYAQAAPSPDPEGPDEGALDDGRGGADVDG